MAPLDDYRIILEVDERGIDDVKKGQRGQMILSALPNKKFGFVIEKLIPISNAKEGRNYFKVEARPAASHTLPSLHSPSPTSTNTL